MSFGFGDSSIDRFKAQSAYKDGGGMGGGGMYMRQGKKRKGELDEDIFNFNDEDNENDIIFDKDIEEKDIPRDNLYNKFVNWFRSKKH